ncbi:hypothetical protein CY0110_18352 [Crocosphaera chwakensis CCY0110]|uniref:Uncharacterized protein n=1 Tax=Crocosphaera chwakensis CCY0110 TaxID=391612 RepID=A3IJ02_9CHRO|nr:hypothetical protein CY0110_18352 [Crocosphaera chwakensis CCY0110]
MGISSCDGFSQRGFHGFCISRLFC